MERVSLKQFVAMHETQVAAARELGVERNTLSNWLYRAPDDYEITLSGKRREVVKIMKRVWP